MEIMAIRRRIVRMTGAGGAAAAAPSSDQDKDGEIRPLVEDEDESSEKKEKKKFSHEEMAAVAKEGCGCGSPSRLENTSFHVAKWVILRLIGLVYAFAFLGAYQQNRGLMGTDGLSPADEYMATIVSRFPDTGRGRFDGFLSHPTVFWWIDLTDGTLDGAALLGLVLSLVVALLGLDSWLVMATLWMTDFSIVTVAEGGSFYSYGWESQLLETGFLAIFLCDLPSVVRVKNAGRDGTWRWRVSSLWRDSHHQIRRASARSAIEGAASRGAPSLSALWLLRWLSFRISLGAGLIKVRGGSCWAAKTCLWYHFETQPVPSPLSFAFHFLPRSALSRAVDLDLCVQLYTSWFVLVPGWGAALRWMRRAGGAIQALFMVNIILSGNFAFLNHLTIIPALACLDDACWPRWLHRFVCGESRAGETGFSDQTEMIIDRKLARFTRWAFDLSLVAIIGSLSVPVISNLFQWEGRHQVMNASFGSFRLVNTYGAFGSVGHDRYEPILSVSSNGTDWTEVEFPCKPGRVDRRPCFSAPYHYRLDWNIWFIGFKPHQGMLQKRERWLYDLVRKILDPSPSSSFGEDGKSAPWIVLLDRTAANVVRPLGGEIPKFAKVAMYHYTMSESLWALALRWVRGEKVTWWNRTFEEALIPPVVFSTEVKKLQRVQLP